MKKVGILLATALLTVGLLGCGSVSKDTATVKDNKGEDKKEIIVGSTPVPHEEILKEVAKVLEKDGYKLTVKVFTDYQIPNRALSEGEIDANFFQHEPFLKNQVKEKNYDLVSTAKVHIEPMGLYSKKVKNLKDIKDGAEIAIPNDPTNCDRALKVLENAKLIKVKQGDLITKIDITENKKNLKITEIDAAQLPRVISDIDAAVINTNFAVEAGLNPLKDALCIEAKDSPYANLIAVRSCDKDKPFVKELTKALNSPEVKKFIEDKYKGSIIPAF